MLPNLPRLSVIVIGEHVYVSLMDCIADLLGDGVPVDVISQNSAVDGVTS
jgi:hypothetical protein